MCSEKPKASCDSLCFDIRLVAGVWTQNQRLWEVPVSGTRKEMHCLTVCRLESEARCAQVAPAEAKGEPVRLSASGGSCNLWPFSALLLRWCSLCLHFGG